MHVNIYGRKMHTENTEFLKSAQVSKNILMLCKLLENIDKIISYALPELPNSRRR
jgi:hypothetical protein